MSKISPPQHIHLWIYNHSFHGISDQIEFFVLTFCQYGYFVTVGKEPKVEAQNVVIENFSPSTLEPLITFCSTYHKKVAVIMTEHIDFIDQTIFMHGEQLWTLNDYMHPDTQVQRLRSLIACKNYILAFLTLGDLPKLKGISEMFLDISVLRIPFPHLPYIDNQKSSRYDAVFTGFVTKYRKKLLLGLRKSYTIHCPTTEKFLSRAKRGAIYEESKIILNLPQRPEWEWLSLMRIIAALKHGKATISIGTNDTSEIAHCVYQIPSNPDLKYVLDHYLSDVHTTYTDAYERYISMSESFVLNHPFPNSLFEYWALLEQGTL